MRRLAEGDIDGAADALSWEDPFPALLGGSARILHDGLQPGAPGRARLDQGRRAVPGRPFVPAGAPAEGKRTGKSVAVVGSGPAGLSAAYFLTMMDTRLPSREGAACGASPPGHTGLPAAAQVVEAAYRGSAPWAWRSGPGARCGPKTSRASRLRHDALLLPWCACAYRAGIEGDGSAGQAGAFLPRGGQRRKHKGDAGEHLVIGVATRRWTRRGPSCASAGGPPSSTAGQDEMPAFADEIHEALEEGFRSNSTGPGQVERGKGKKLLVTLITMRAGPPDASAGRAPYRWPGPRRLSRRTA